MSIASRIIVLTVVVCSFGKLFLGSPAVAADQDKEIPIYPTWRLMNDEARRQFTAGYIFGHREAKALGEVVVEYLKQNPNPKAEEVAAVLNHYRLTTMTANQLVPMIDEHLGEPENQRQSMRVIINNLNRK